MAWRASLLAVALTCACLARGAVAEAPRRVVSMNLCTDQLAMLLAAPGQLAAVSPVARDPVSSAMWREAAAVPVHAGSAEAILGLAPDLVVAGEWEPPATIAMLRRLGVRVERFPVEASFGDIEANLLRMGALLGREDVARRVVAEMRAGLAGAPDGPGPRAALYYANGYTSGSGTLADAILAAAGLENVAAERGVAGLASLPLEVLVMEAPDLLVLGQDYPSPALAQGILRHPALGAIEAGRAAVADNLWVCGLPSAVEAVAALRAAVAR